MQTINVTSRHQRLKKTNSLQSLLILLVQLHAHYLNMWSVIGSLSCCFLQICENGSIKCQSAGFVFRKYIFHPAFSLFTAECTMCIKPSLQKGKIWHIYTNVKCDVFSQEILCSMFCVLTDVVLRGLGEKLFGGREESN